MSLDANENSPAAGNIPEQENISGMEDIPVSETTAQDEHVVQAFAA